MSVSIADRGALPSTPDATFRWLAVWTKPRAEKAVARALTARAVPVWLPLFTARRQWSDRWKDVEFPLFPGYLFAQAPAEGWTSLIGVPGVLTIVKQGSSPAWIRNEHMTNLQRTVETLGMTEEEPEVEVEFVPGDLVRVVEGPLARLVGTVRELRGGRRLLVGIEQIGRAISISIGAAKVERVEGAR